MADAKPRPGDKEKDQVKRIHAILNEYDGEIALKKIRDVIYSYDDVVEEDNGEEKDNN